MGKSIIIKSRHNASNKRPVTRSVAGFDISYYDEHSPFSHNDSLKKRWLIASSIAGLFGAFVIGGAFLFTYESGQVTTSVSRQDAKLASRNPQKSLIRSKSDQTEIFIGDVPVLAEKKVTNEIEPGNPFTNIAVSFGRSKVKSNKLAKTAALPKADQSALSQKSNRKTSAKSNKAEIITAESNTPNQASVLGTINLGDKISDIMGLPTSKPTVLPQATASLEPGFSVNGNVPREPGANVTRVTKREPRNKATNVPFETVSVSPGDTLVNILTDRGAYRDDAIEIVEALKPQFAPSSIKEGQKVTFALVPAMRDGNKIMTPSRLELAVGPNKRLTVERDAHGGYAVLSDTLTDGDKDQFHAQAVIKKSLYVAARNQGIPDNIIVDMMRIHAYDVDFQREVRVGDSFELFYGDENTLERSNRGKVLFSSLTLNGKAKGYYRFKTPDDSIVDYYDEKGVSAKKFLIRTPVVGARISSRYGMRRHPITRKRKLHSGVDFAAPRGTPIKAAGNGIVVKKGGVSGYGNYIEIRHANGYLTAYAHMAGYGPGIRPGKRIRQGQIIGYVGSTGRSTGNHLHYEVRLNKKPINPMRVKVPTGRQLSGKMLALFKEQKTKIDSLRRTAPTATRVAAAREAQRDDVN